jgi:hypothetical protein
MMLRLGTQHVVLLLAAATAALPSQAANDIFKNECDAKVVTVGQPATDGSTVTMKFKVTTGCDSSFGGFSYTYLTSADPKPIERNSENWTPSNGRVFDVLEKLTPGSKVTISHVTVGRVWSKRATKN